MTFGRDYLDCLAELGILNKDNLQAFDNQTLKTLGTIAGITSLSASLVGTGIRAYTDISLAQTKIRDGEIANLFYTHSMLLKNRMTRGLSQLMDNNCLDVGVLSGWNALDDQCKDLKGLESYTQNYLNQRLNRSLHRSEVKKSQNDAHDIISDILASIYLIYETERLIRVADVLNNMPIANPSYFDPTSNRVIRGMPAGDRIVGNPQQWGGYIFSLGIKLPTMNLYGRDGVEIYGITDEGYSTNMMFSPGADLGMWIGKLDISYLNEPSTYRLNLQLNAPQSANATVLDVLGLYLGKAGEVQRVNNPECSVSRMGVSCTFTASKLLEGNYSLGKIDLRLNAYGKEQIISLDLSEPLRPNMSITKELSECSRLETLDFRIPDSIEPNRNYRLTVNISDDSRFLTVPGQCRTQGEAVIEWFMATVPLGSGTSVEFTTPDKRTLAMMGREVVIGIHICKGDVCTTRSKVVRINANNSPPEIRSIGIDDRIASQVKEFRPSVQVLDADGDPVSLQWSVSDESILLPGEKFLVNHLTIDRTVKVCLSATDGLATAVSCKNVVVERAVSKPEILSVRYSMLNQSVPTDVQFEVVYASDSPIRFIRFTDNQGRSLQFRENTFTVRIENHGNYQLSFVAEDDAGRTSEPYTLNLAFYPGVNLSAEGRIVDLNQDNVILSLNTLISGGNIPAIIQYLIDTNSDGVFDIILPGNQSSFEILIPKDTSGSITIGIYTDRGTYTTRLPLSGVSPFVRLNATPSRGTPPLTVSFSVDAFAFGTRPTQYEYDFEGDGTINITSQERTASFSYNSPGTYSPTVNVSFENGLRGRSATIVEVIGLPNITRNAYGTAISQDGKIVAGVVNLGPDFNDKAFVWRLKPNAALGAINFVENEGQFVATELPRPQGVTQRGLYTRGASLDGTCIAGLAADSGTNRPIAWILEENGIRALSLQTSCSSGNEGYDCAIIGGRYVIVGRTCPDSPYATIWEGERDISATLTTRFGTGFGILHSISANGVISGSAYFRGVMWNRSQEPSARVMSDVYSRYHSVISEDGLVAAFHNDGNGSMQVVRKLDTDTWRVANVSNFTPYAVVNEGNERFAVYGTRNSRASKVVVDFSGNNPTVSQVEDLNTTFASILPSGVTLTEIRGASPDGRFLLCTARVDNYTTPCIIDTALARASSTVQSAIAPQSVSDKPQPTAGGGCSMTTGGNLSILLPWLILISLFLIRRKFRKT